MRGKYAFVMMIQERWWNRFLSRHDHGKLTHSYVRKGLAPPKSANMILFYVAKPVGEIAGYAEFIERKVGNAAELWKEYGQESVLESQEQFDEFVLYTEKASFIRFRNLHKATHPIPLNDVLMLLGVRRLARKGFYVDKDIVEELVSHMETQT